MSLFRKAATSLIPDGMPLPILAGPLRGKWWLAGSAPGPSKGLSVLFNRSEPGQLSEAKRLAFEGSVCLDVGAHVGIYSLIFSLRAQRVYAFEPFPRNLAWLMRTLSINCVDNVQVMPWALSGETGLTQFQSGEHHTEGRMDPKGELPVYAITGDDFCDRYGVVPNVIKIDVEGAEARVLQGAKTLLKAKKPALLLSTHGDAVKEECFRLLTEYGYGKPKGLDHPSLDEAAEFVFEA